MTKNSFLARTTWGQPNYLLVAMACAFVVALIPWGAWRALDGSSNNAQSWLPAAYHEVQDLAWFDSQFHSEHFALVSWDGCTLGNAEKLELLAKKLTGAGAAPLAEPSKKHTAPARWYTRVVTGPQVIRQLMTTQVGVNYAAAIKRLEGALVGRPQRDAHGRTLGNDTRVTCLVVSFSQDAMRDSGMMRAAVEGITQIAADECGINPATIHMGGPPADNVRIDVEGQHTLLRLAPLAGLLGVVLCYWRLRSARLSAIVLAVGAISAGLSLALVFYFGVFEVLSLGRRAPEWGTLDAVLMAMPAIVYLFAVTAALHGVNYYLQARREQGDVGAAERAVLVGMRPTVISALAAAAALAALATSHILPIQKFGLFSAVSVTATVGVLLSVMPVLLHRYPLRESAIHRRTAQGEPSRIAAWSMIVFHSIVDHSGAALAFFATLFIALSIGAFKLGPSVKILGLLDRNSDLIQDYAWFEKHLGNLVPMEVVLTMPPERLRTGDEHAEQDGQQYRLTMLERLELLRQIQRRLEAFPQISRALSAATFAPAATETGLGGANRSADYAKNKGLEFNRDRLLAGDYLRMEREAGTDRLTGRELWRLNARVAALAAGDVPVDYGAFLGQLKRAVEPVLWAYQQRDLVVRALHEQGKQLAGSRVCVLFRAPDRALAPPANAQEQALAELLTVSGVAPRGVTYFNLGAFERPGRADDAQDNQYRQSALASLRKQDAVILASASSDGVAKQIAAEGVYVVDVTALPAGAEFTSAPLADDGGPRPIRAVFTGLAPVVDRTQRELMTSLRHGVLWAVGLATAVVTLSLMSVPAGLLSMVTSLLPLAALFGAMGWLGLKIDLGMAMTAGVAIGVALEGTIHFTHWFRCGLQRGLSRREAVLWAYERSGAAMIETALIAGVGLSAFTLSGFSPVRDFGCFMAAMLPASLIGNLVMLPALLASPLGWFFAPAAVRRLDPLWPRLQAKIPQKSVNVDAGDAGVETELLPMPQPQHSPHFVEDPAPVRRGILRASHDERQEIAEGPHAALHAKLQNLRRPRAGDSTT